MLSISLFADMLYDSPDFSLNGVNPSHNYALQPLVLKTLNSLGETDYYNGLDPDIIAYEDSSNMGIIGDLANATIIPCQKDFQD